MAQVLIVFGILLALLGLVAVVRPVQLLQLARKVTVTTWLRLIAFAFRTLLGCIVILAAPSTGFPLTMRVVGSLLILSGLAALLLGNASIQGILNRVLRQGPATVVIGGLVGILLGGLLIYAGW